MYNTRICTVESWVLLLELDVLQELRIDGTVLIITARGIQILDCKFFYMALYGRRYFQHAHFIPIVGVGKRGVY